MARHAIYPAPGDAGYLLDVQADLLEELNTRIVVPLLPSATAPAPARILNPIFEISGVSHVMVTQFLSAVPAAILKRPTGSLSDHADEITRALDMAFQGF